ncbi:MAG: ABC transporter substrate-binding protein [Syntrophomonadaceae bacterium]|jgi:branched-chain amino acid transport system substrate-binding protein
MFKRSFGVILVVMLLLSVAGPAMAVPNVFLNGQKISFDVSPVIENGRTLIPMREVFEKLGADISWDNYTQTVTAITDTDSVKLQIGNEYATVAGQAVQLDVPGKIINGRTMIPVRFISQIFVASVDWDPVENQVNITTTDQTIKPVIPNTKQTKPAIGLNLELTGPVAVYGNNVNQGIQLAFSENQDLDLKLVTADCQSNQEEAFIGSQKLLQHNIIAQIGPLTSGNVTGCTQLLEESGIPLLAPAATAPFITLNSKTGETRNYIFRVCFQDAMQGNLMAAFAGKELKAKTCAIIYDGTSDYGKALADSFKTSFTRAGGQIVAEEQFSRDDTDFTQILEKVKNQKFDFIYAPGYYQEIGWLIKQARELGISQPIGGCDGWDSPQITVLAGSQAMNNTYLINHFSVDDPDAAVVDFVNKYKSTYGDLPDTFAALGYDSAKLLLETIRNSKSYNPQVIADNLSKIENFSGVTGRLTMGSDHNPIKSGVVMEFQNGKQVFRQRVYSE